MAGFSSQHYPFLLDSAFQPNTTTTITAMSSLLEGEIYASATPTEIAFPTPTHESSCFGNDRKVDSCNKTSVMKTEKPESPTSMVSTLLEKGEMDGFCFSYCSPDVSPEIVVTAAMHAINCDKNNGNGNNSFVIEMEKEVTLRFERKRKNRDGCCLVNAQPKEGKGEKQKNRSCSSMKGKEKKPKAEKKETGIFEEPSTGYIHVRARRGQATDRHSLAERVRREKISERMKLLQGLVPSCDKVTGKAQILDEIINYVQSLQNQVEFLSIKLASVAPMFFNLGPDIDDYMPEQEEIRSFPSPLPPIQQSIHNQATGFAVTTTTSKTFPTINYPIMENADSILHSPSDFSQDTCNLAWDVKDQGPNIFSKAGYDNTASFQ